MTKYLVTFFLRQSPHEIKREVDFPNLDEFIENVKKDGLQYTWSELVHDGVGGQKEAYRTDWYPAKEIKCIRYQELSNHEKANPANNHLPGK